MNLTKLFFIPVILIFMGLADCFSQQTAQEIYDQGYKDGYSEGFKQGYKRSLELTKAAKSKGGDENLGIVDQILEADTSKMIEQVLDPLRAIEEEDLKRIVYEKAGKNEVGRWLRDKEWFLNWCVAMIKHPDALPELGGILKERKQIWRFLLANVLIIVLNLTAKRYIRLRQMDRKYTYYRIISVALVNFLVFWTYFGHNLKPTIFVTFSVIF